jgi:TRAP-type C4-dicarboxylate transport system permease small subunit
MTDFDALLKRSFAEAPEPVDDGFSVQVTKAVAHREAAAKTRNAAYVVGMGAACAAMAYGGYSLVAAFGQEAMALAGIEIARAHAAVSNAPSIGGAAESIVQSLSAGMTQILLVTAALAGGAVAYRAAQD